ncbi:MAG: xanthine dehydrogenase accessory protein XdhC [Betaproteobacteria bacterium AqS2]|uniref:Xanthine dehydrogenase accessory protein XdhC n=1 Tax=Candidatus Amphirhobacter heronislandensis TaxID=1732024 RepID=A0A930Y114_9GAMM|nr:xanthine dehydrogenase accessory protein XdhC [Betaproteobacteria bacterium AqS2]
MNADWLSTAQRWRTAGRSFVIVTVLGVRGSAPVEAGRKMLVSADNQHGTVGGGRLEQEVLAEARAWLAGTAGPKAIAAWNLGARLGQCCGGKVVVHYELLAAREPVIAVFGAGHVAQELIPILLRLPHRVLCVDSRPDWLQRLPAADRLELVEEEDPADAAADLPAGSLALVMTHRHDADLAASAALLARGDIPFVGVIGSGSKAARFRRALAAKGLDLGAFACPIGEQTAKDPASVAIMIAARLCRELAGAEAPDSAKNAVKSLLAELM